MAYISCEIIKRKGGLLGANYKFKCINSDGPTTICVKGETINKPSAIAKCRNGEFDDSSDCENW